jgi:hypothetical protein
VAAHPHGPVDETESLGDSPDLRIGRDQGIERRIGPGDAEGMSDGIRGHQALGWRNRQP